MVLGHPSGEKVQCLCGKWWALRQPDGSLALRCKLCKREIMVTGEKLRVRYL